jgi:hypothetical protein
MTRHPLIGRLLRWDTEDGGQFTVSRFTDDLGNGYFLAMRLCPTHGTDLDVSHIVSLEMLAEREGADIYPDWETLAEVTDCPHEDDDNEEVETPELGQMH